VFEAKEEDLEEREELEERKSHGRKKLKKRCVLGREWKRA